MHEVSLAERMLRIALEAAQANGGGRVISARLLLGALSGAEPESLRQLLRPALFLLGYVAQTVVDVRQQRPQPNPRPDVAERRRQRQRVGAAGEADDDDAPRRARQTPASRQQPLLEADQAAPAPATRCRRCRDAHGPSACGREDWRERGTKEVPTGGIEPPAKGL